MLAPKPTCRSPTPSTSTKRRRDMTTTSTTTTTTTATTTSTSSTLRRISKKQPQTPSPKIWRTRAQLETLTFAPLTAHKMSSVGNAFASDDLYGSFDDSVAEESALMIRSTAEDSPSIIYPQHTDVMRSSPLSIQSDDEVNNQSLNFSFPVVLNESGVEGGLMTWNQRGNQWISLVYRYVFPASAFDVPSSARPQKPTAPTRLPPSTAFSPHKARRVQSSFSFPPPQESIMMGSGSLTPAFAKEQISSEAEAREACQKLLQLIDDESLMLPLMRSSLESLKSVAEAQSAVKPVTNNKTLRSLHSEWSSLPSSPPPPIFHDGYNRPIPELRLSPPMTTKQGASSKKLFFATQQNAITESPLTKRLRMSSSASSSSLI